MSRDPLNSADMNAIRKAENCGDPELESRAQARLAGTAKYHANKKKLDPEAVKRICEIISGVK